jgi:hypothetical protein
VGSLHHNARDVSNPFLAALGPVAEHMQAMQTDLQACHAKLGQPSPAPASVLRPHYIAGPNADRLSATLCPSAWALLRVAKITQVSTQGLLCLALEAAQLRASSAPACGRMLVIPSDVSAITQQPCFPLDEAGIASHAASQLAAFVAEQMHSRVSFDPHTIRRTTLDMDASGTAALFAQAGEPAALRCLIQLQTCTSPAFRGAAERWLRAALVPDAASVGAAGSQSHVQLVASLQEALAVPRVAHCMLSALAAALEDCSERSTTAAQAVPVLQLLPAVCIAAGDLACAETEAFQALIGAAWPFALALLQGWVSTGSEISSDACQVAFAAERTNAACMAATEAVRLVGVLWGCGVREEVLLGCKYAEDREQSLAYLRLLLALPLAARPMGSSMQEVRIVRTNARVCRHACGSSDCVVCASASALSGLCFAAFWTISYSTRCRYGSKHSC